jgi:hypothetical protein
MLQRKVELLQCDYRGRLIYGKSWRGGGGPFIEAQASGGERALCCNS